MPARSRPRSSSASPGMRPRPASSRSAWACRPPRASWTSCSGGSPSASSPTPASCARRSADVAPRDTEGAVMEPRVIVLEDDSELRALLRRGLGEEGFEVTTASTAAELLDRIAKDEADALVVDIGLPDADGRDVVQALRARGIGTPVLFLTARDALPDRLAGFAAGGDDYVTKPFAFAEFVARLRALIRRGGTDPAVGAGGGRPAPAPPAGGGGGGDAARPGAPCGMEWRREPRADPDGVPDPGAARRRARRGRAAARAR